MTAEEWVNKGVELGKVGRYQEALEAFGEAIKLNPHKLLRRGVTKAMPSATSGDTRRR